MMMADVLLDKTAYRAQSPSACIDGGSREQRVMWRVTRPQAARCAVLCSLFGRNSVRRRWLTSLDSGQATTEKKE